MLRLTFIVLALCVTAGCATRVPAAGDARRQTPQTGSPDQPFVAFGRCTVTTPTLRLSCRAVVRRLPGGEIRLALLADEGVLLLDLTRTATGTTVHLGQPGLREHAELISRTLFAWMTLPTTNGRWEDDRWVLTSPDGQYWCGGDPLLLRRIAGNGPDLDIGDYRQVHGGLLAHLSRLSSPTLALTLALTPPEPGE